MHPNGSYAHRTKISCFPLCDNFLLSKLTVSQLNLDLPGKIRHYGWDSVSSHGMPQMTAALTHKRDNRSQRGFTKKNILQLTVLILTPHWQQGNTGGFGRSECQIIGKEHMKNIFILKAVDKNEWWGRGNSCGIRNMIIIIIVSVFVCVHVYNVWIALLGCVCYVPKSMYGGQKRMLAVFLYCCLPFCLETGSLLNGKLTLLARLARWLSPPTCAAVTDLCYHALISRCGRWGFGLRSASLHSSTLTLSHQKFFLWDLRILALGCSVLRTVFGENLEGPWLVSGSKCTLWACLGKLSPQCRNQQRPVISQ